MNNNSKTKIKMWYKVQELTQLGLNKSQIRLETGLDRSTIGKYQSIDEDTFHRLIREKRSLPKKLRHYRNYVKNLINQHPYLSAAQVEDRLKERYQDLPCVHSKTVYNFVESIRREYNIPKPRKLDTRVYEKLPEPDYGSQAQVDFGESWLQTRAGKRRKVYFFTMILCRSRYKYVYLQVKPFTSTDAVTAHHLAFDYYRGIPREIVYDQDSVFIHNENLGDYLLTKEFSAFCKHQSFKAVFCRKSDPQSKGKVENVVKYVKQNFLRGREFIGIDLLNQQALGWLSRTANAKVHSGIQLVPAREWEKEKRFLLPVRTRHTQQQLRSYKVRKDNTLLYKSNFYSLPLGTYKDAQSQVLVQIKGSEILIYNASKTLLCRHKLSLDKGKTIRNSDHKRPKSQSLEQHQQQVLNLLGQNPMAENYLQALHKDKSRYYRDNLVYIAKNWGNYRNETIGKGLVFCMENRIFNGRNLIEIFDKIEKENSAPHADISEVKPTGISTTQNKYNNLEISDINDYEKLFN